MGQALGCPFHSQLPKFRDNCEGERFPGGQSKDNELPLVSHGHQSDAAGGRTRGQNITELRGPSRPRTARMRREVTCFEERAKPVGVGAEWWERSTIRTLDVMLGSMRLWSALLAISLQIPPSLF